MPDRFDVRNAQLQLWAAGDFSMVAMTNTIVAELLCESVDVRSGQKVLDVATGSGNAALAAARRWCDVTGIDFVPALLQKARERAATERLEITFADGDAERIPFPDAAFDVVLSTFGAMFAPDQQLAADELLRVCRPGGKIGMTNWTPDSIIGDLGRLSATDSHSPSQLPSPMRWGTEAGLRELFGDRVASLEVTRKSFVTRFRSVQHWLGFHREFLGPVKTFLESLAPAAQKEIGAAVAELVGRYNRSGDATLVMPSDYLEVVAVRR